MFMPGMIDAVGVPVLAALAGAVLAPLTHRFADWWLSRVADDAASAPGLPGERDGVELSYFESVQWQARASRFTSMPLCAMLNALAFAGCAWRFGSGVLAMATMLFCAALIVLAVIDVRASLLPDVVTLPLLWLGLLVNLHGALSPLTDAVLGAACGYGFLWLTSHAYRIVTGREGMGHGDFKLLAALGAWLGVQALPVLLLAASLAGVAVGLGLRFACARLRGHPLPFGPFLVVGALWLLFAHGAAGV